MSKTAAKLVVLAIILIVGAFVGQSPKHRSDSETTPTTTAESSKDALQTWGRPDTLEDHFRRHGSDFQARDPRDYAAKAAALLARAQTVGLPAKRDSDGSIRVYDPATGAFGSYNSNGTTRTFFKPGNPSYFDRQPGERVDLRGAR